MTHRDIYRDRDPSFSYLSRRDYVTVNVCSKNGGFSSTSSFSSCVNTQLL